MTLKGNCKKASDPEMPHPPHFMQPVLPGFNSVPVAFFGYYLHGRKCGVAMLRSPRGGELWPVKICRMKFSQGWKEFVAHLDLQVGDFLVFRHEGDLVFDVNVFDPSTCEREYTSEKVDVMNQRSEDCRGARNVGSKGNKIIRKKSHGPSSSSAKCTTFVGTVRPSYENVLYLPMRFTRPNGMGSECLEMIVIDQSGKAWPIKLGHRKKDQRAHAYWRAFKEANSLSVGDKFSFEIVKKGKNPVLQFCRMNMKNKVIKKKSNMKICKQVAVSIAGQSPAPHFLGIMLLSDFYKAYNLVPREFTMIDESALVNKQGETSIRCSAEDSWVILMRNHKYQRIYISSGRRTLAIQNVQNEGNTYMNPDGTFKGN